MPEHGGEYLPPWFAYFSGHGDPHVCTDLERPYSTAVATVATGPEDYGRANCLLMAAAPEMLNLLRRVSDCYEGRFPEGKGGHVFIDAETWNAVKDATEHFGRSGAPDA